MILDIPTHIEQGIIQVAQNQNETEELNFVGMWANHENSVEEQIQQLRQQRTFQAA